jgi:hypothetical protein
MNKVKGKRNFAEAGQAPISNFFMQGPGKKAKMGDSWGK